ncbi:MAG TPA: ABC transporter ATP-binding protein [Chloroflexota bacterium]|nr:ABC transporter ATP-binding protein [Chloroflexota bacterium]HUM68810.1 ABC transporter ATP-binding protein [Chloroflexota bacterium]
MKTHVKFENVTKQYHLGLTRTSLPTIISGWVKRSLGKDNSGGIQNRSFLALEDVNFELRSGESLALVGANGAGKTTILKLLANISKPTTGSIYMDGHLSALIELGAGFHPDLTGRENIFLNGTILGLSRKQIASQFDEIVDFSELEQFIDTPVKRYSSGMTVRLGFAVASCINPEILLVDEVLAVGDAAFQQKCMQRIRELIGKGTSIIFVSHNFYLIQAVCNRALYLEKGRVKNAGSPKEIIALYEQDLHQRRTAKLENMSQVFDDETGDVEITRVEVIGTQSGESASLANNQPAQIRIHYNAYKPLGKVHVSVFIHRSDGLTCCMMRTKLDNFDLTIERGQGVVSLNLEPLQLITGTYYAEAWFLNESDSIGIVTRAGRSDWFSVKGSVLSYTDDSGVFEPNTHWSHQPHLASSDNGNFAEPQLVMTSLI